MASATPVTPRVTQVPEPRWFCQPFSWFSDCESGTPSGFPALAVFRVPWHANRICQRSRFPPPLLRGPPPPLSFLSRQRFVAFFCHTGEMSPKNKAAVDKTLPEFAKFCWFFFEIGIIGIIKVMTSCKWLVEKQFLNAIYNRWKKYIPFTSKSTFAPDSRAIG